MYNYLCIYTLFVLYHEYLIVYMTLSTVYTCSWRRWSMRGSEKCKTVRYRFWCTRCAFRLMKSRQWYLDRKSWKSGKKNVKSVKSGKNQILCHEMEPNPSKDRAMHEGDNPSFLDKFMIFTFYLIVLFMFVFLSKYRSA